MENIKIPQILYEDNHLIVVNKAPGTLSQGDGGGDPCVSDILKTYIKKRDAKSGNVFLGQPHRLDRPCSGVLLVAKTSKMLSRLTALFRDGLVRKVYWTVIEKLPQLPEGELVHFLKKDKSSNKSCSVCPGIPGAKLARLSYRCLESVGKYFLVEVTLLTGRHHQIRVQFSTIGSPIVGDCKYGARETSSPRSICLHARSLDFEHPVARKPLKIIASPPSAEPIWNSFHNVAG